MTAHCQGQLSPSSVDHSTCFVSSVSAMRSSVQIQLNLGISSKLLNWLLYIPVALASQYHWQFVQIYLKMTVPGETHSDKFCIIKILLCRRHGFAFHMSLTRSLVSFLVFTVSPIETYRMARPSTEFKDGRGNELVTCGKHSILWRCVEGTTLWSDKMRTNTRTETP
jgi:hypothetical protein